MADRCPSNDEDRAISRHAGTREVETRRLVEPLGQVCGYEVVVLQLRAIGRYANSGPAIANISAGRS